MSLGLRQIAAASLVLVAFLGLTGLSLDRAFREIALDNVRDRLQAQVYMLIGAAELSEDNRLAMPTQLPEARYAMPNSGLYAVAVNRYGGLVWRSDSTIGLRLQFPPLENPGINAFHTLELDGQGQFYAVGLTTDWEMGDELRRYSFWVAEDSSRYVEQVDSFRQALWSGLLLTALLLLLVQLAVLRWSLRPLRQLAEEIARIESGQQKAVSTGLPRELRPLALRLNQLVTQNHTRLERHRHALGDLAHSLKTPLAVLNSTQDLGDDALRQTLRQQVARMDQAVEYQLQRASAAGRIALAAPIDTTRNVRQLVNTLAKVHRDKGLHIAVDVSPGLAFYGDQGDLLEIIGNLLENACKWAKQRIRVQARGDGRHRWELVIEDDGPGIPEDQRERLLERGARADPSTPGHGIGLAIVREIVQELYQGELVIGDSDLGGAHITVRLKFD